MVWFKNFRYVILWSALILALSLFPGSHIPRIPVFFELLKPASIAHLVLFTVFSFLLLQSILKQYGSAFFRFYGIIIALLIGVSFGGITEYLQFALKVNRSGNIYDFITNALGCLLGLLVFLIISRKKLKKANAN